MDRLVLGFSPGVQPVFLYAVEIADVMAGGRLPAAAFGGWELVELGTDARRATFLAPGRVLRARVLVDQLGLSLRFSQGAPAEFQEAFGGAALRLKILDARGGSRVIVSELGAQEEAAWVDSRVSLDEWLGQEITLEFELELGATGFRALSQPMLCSEAEAPATVLLVTSDTHRADHLGFLFTDGGLRTDAIDGLARRGVVFTDAVASINNTTPSHVALMTGLSPRDTGSVANALPLSDVAPTLAETFRDLGYATLAAVSASPVSYRYSGLGQGFDRYTGPGERSARSARETLEELQGWLPEFEDAPLFLWVHVYDAHGPYDPPEEYRGLYYPVGRDPYAARSSEGAVRAPKWDRGLQDPEFAIALYRSEITAQDEVLGELLARPRFGEGAIIAFTADHGETLLRGMEEPFGHLSLTYNTLAVPLILVAPGLTPGEVRAAPVQQTDVARALLNLAGYAGVEFPGEDLLGSGASSERPRFGVQANGDGASVLHGRWLLVLNLTGRQRDWGSAEESLHAVRLFDIVADPYCEQDVSAGHMSAAGSLRGLLIAWLGEGAQNDWLSEPNGSRLKIQQQLEELGYTASSSAGSAGSWIDLECSCERCALFLGFR
jgi:arylsulfatase